MQLLSSDGKGKGKKSGARVGLRMMENLVEALDRSFLASEFQSEQRKQVKDELLEFGDISPFPISSVMSFFDLPRRVVKEGLRVRQC